MKVDPANDSCHLPLIDVHAHLDEVPQVEEELEKARKKGVRAVVGVGMDLKSNRFVLELADRFPHLVFPAVGIHPWNINQDSLERDLAFVADHLSRCVALGEVGLDYKAKVKKTLQKEVFRKLLDIACKHRKPVITHSRFSHQSTLKMVLEAGVEKAIFHWYSGPLALLDEIVAQGFLISATPALAYSKAHQQAVQKVPLTSLVLETDCPVKYGDLESRPEHVLLTLNHVCRIKGLDPQIVAQATFKTAKEFFGLPL